MANANGAIRKAAEIIANQAKANAARFSKRIPLSFRISVRSGNATISAGGEAAPNAIMFETPGARHPLFGDREYWYTQPYRPFMEEAAEEKADEAMQSFADDMIEQMLNENGI